MLTTLILLLGCSATSDSTDSKGGGGTDTQDSEVPAGDEPVVTGHETSCSPNTDGEDTWFVNVTVTDPQGDDTFQRGSLGVYGKDPSTGADPLDEVPMVCTTGSCLTSLEDLTGKAGCEIAGKVWMRITVTDDDGNVSEPYDFQPSA
jgi:hypothetical protein